MIRARVTAKASTKTALTDFLSVPKIIGIGPIITIPATSALSFSERRDEAKINAETITMTPITTKTIPRVMKKPNSNFPSSRSKRKMRQLRNKLNKLIRE
jgi:hypothetical protein